MRPWYLGRHNISCPLCAWCKTKDKPKREYINLTSFDSFYLFVLSQYIICKSRESTHQNNEKNVTKGSIPFVAWITISLPEKSQKIENKHEKVKTLTFPTHDHKTPLPQSHPPNSNINI